MTHLTLGHSMDILMSINTDHTCTETVIPERCFAPWMNRSHRENETATAIHTPQTVLNISNISQNIILFLSLFSSCKQVPT